MGCEIEKQKKTKIQMNSELKWQNINDAQLYVTEEKQMGISISPNTNSGAMQYAGIKLE